MNPSEALRDIRTMAQRLEDHEDLGVRQLVADVTSLDDWVSAGGYLPEDWRHRGRPRLTEDGETKDGVRHGTRNAYNQGCHCEKCRAANREAAAAYRARKKGELA